MTRYVAWSRPLFHLLQNIIRIELHRQYHSLQGYYHRTGRVQAIWETLTPAVMNRLSVLIARDKASILWSSGVKMSITASLRSCLTTIHGMLEDPSQRWDEPIGYIIPRIPHVVSFGDASGFGGGPIARTYPTGSTSSGVTEFAEESTRRPITPTLYTSIVSSTLWSYSNWRQPLSASKAFRHNSVSTSIWGDSRHNLY